MEAIYRAAALLAILTCASLPATAGDPQCLAGEYWTVSECLPCSVSYYCPGDDTRILCPAGTYGSTTGLTSSSCSGQCQAGYYCPAGSSSAAANSCTLGSFCPTGSSADADCGVGHYCPTTISRYICPAGTYCSGLRATSSTPCPAGSYCTEGAASPTPCPAGYYCPVGSSSATANSCTLGSFCPAGSSADADCGVGHYCPTTISRYICPSGTYCSGLRATSPTPCPAGSYCTEGAASPTPCPAGTYGSTTGLTSSSCSGQCQAGYYCPAGSSSATANSCTLGSFCPAGSSADADCGVGHYCPTTISRYICPSGTYCSGLRATSPTPCPAGSYCTEGAASPTPCPAGTYGSTTGLTTSSCSGQCQAGYYCPAGSSSATANSCTLGSFCQAGSSSDADCGVGHYCPTTISRYICPSGTYCSGLRATSPTPCPAGSYCTEGVASPTPCPAGRYGSTTGLTTSSCSGQCQDGYYCPAGSTTALGAGPCDASCATCEGLSDTDCTSCGGGYTLGAGACSLTVTLDADPLRLGAGDQTQLTWSSEAATSCTATGDWSGSMSISGSTGVLVTETSLFLLDCVDDLGNPGSASVSVTVSGVANDACLNARSIPAAGPFPFDDALSTLDATAHTSDPTPSASCSSGPDGATVWYRYAAPISGTFDISTASSDYDTVASAWNAAEGCGSLVTAVACNDDGATPPQSDLSFAVDAGSTYLLQVGAFGGGTGGQLAVSAIPEPRREWLTLGALASLLLLRRLGLRQRASEPARR